MQLLKSTDLGRHSLLYLKEIGHGWFGKVSALTGGGWGQGLLGEGEQPCGPSSPTPPSAWKVEPEPESQGLGNRHQAQKVPKLILRGSRAGLRVAGLLRGREDAERGPSCSGRGG